MPRTIQSLLVVGLGLFLPGLASAQTTPRPLPAPLVGAGLPSRPMLEEPSVQREIGLTEKQKNNLALIQEEYEANRASPQIPDGQEGFDFNSMMLQNDELDKQRLTAMSRILTTAQKNRLKQLEWQKEGWIALARPEVATRIKLSNPQSQKIRAIVEKMRQDQLSGQFAPPGDQPVPQPASRPAQNLNPSNGFMGDIDTLVPGGGPMKFAGGDTEAQAKKSADTSNQILTAASKEVDDLLTPDQKSGFERLLGNPFDFKGLNAPGPPTKTSKRPGRTTKGTPKTP